MTKIKLSDITNNITDGKHGDCNNEGSSGYYFISVKDLGNYEIDYSNARQITEKDFIETHKRTKLEIGDILLANSGHTIGKIILVKDKPEVEFTTFQKSVAIIKPNRHKIKSEYLYFLLKAHKENLRKAAVGSAQPNLLLTDLRDFPVKIEPDCNKQESLVCSLKNIEDKIELNNKINVRLEAMAKLIYDYWFVQFDFPNEEGMPYKSSGGKMTWSEELKRDIPEGWEVKKLIEILDVGKDQVNPSDYLDVVFKYLSIPVFDVTESYGLEKGRDIGSNKFIVDESDICVSKLNPWFNRVYYPLGNEKLICTTEMVVWKTQKDHFKNFFYELATSKHFIDYCTQSATGTSNSHKRVNPTVMMQYKLPFQKEIIENYGKQVNSVLLKIMKNKNENRKLSGLRDWLLPMLMNGQVNVGPSK